MKRAVVLGLPILLLTACNKYLPPSGWHTIFEDDFIGRFVDTTKWHIGWYGNGTTDNTPPPNSYETACWSPANISFPGDNMLHLKAMNASCKTYNGATYAWTGAGMTTRMPANGVTFNTPKTFHVEFRAKLPASGGAVLDWPALWTAQDCWPTNGEIDVQEGLGNSQYHLHHGVTAGGSCGSDADCGGSCYGGAYASAYADGQFHVFSADVKPISGGSCDWTKPDYIQVTFAVDGADVHTGTMCVDWTATSSSPIGNDYGPPGQYLVLQLSTCSQSWCGTSVSGSELVVDYVAVSVPDTSTTTTTVASTADHCPTPLPLGDIPGWHQLVA